MLKTTLESNKENTWKLKFSKLNKTEDKRNLKESP